MRHHHKLIQYIVLDGFTLYSLVLPNSAGFGRLYLETLYILLVEVLKHQPCSLNPTLHGCLALVAMLQARQATSTMP